MAKKPARLGRGLNSLISSSIIEANPPPQTDKSEPPTRPDSPHRIAIADETTHAGSSRIISELAAVQASQRTTKQPDTAGTDQQILSNKQRLLDVPVEAISPNSNQPRKSFDAVSIGRLAQSIAESGVLQPLLVRAVRTTDDGQMTSEYELIAGERRWRAAKAAGIATVPAILKSVELDTSMEMALVENIQREDLNAIDRARAYAAYCDRTGMTAEEAGRKLGEDRSTITNYLRLLELHPDAIKLVESGKISMGHARALLGCQGESSQVHLAEQAASKGLSVRAVEKLVRARKQGDPRKHLNTPDRPVHLGELEEKLQQAVKTKVKIQPGRGPHRGKIILEYYTLDDFDRIAALLGYSETDAH